MGLPLFFHAVRLVFSQLGGALRVSGILYLVLAVLSGVAYLFIPEVKTARELEPNFWPLLGLSLVSGVFYLWIAVAWHRFVLLDEIPTTLVPRFHGNRMLAYFGRLIQAFFIGFVVGLLLSFANTALAYVARGNIVVNIIGLVAFLTILLLIGYRLAPILPGAAIGRPVGIGGAWAATAGASGDLLALAFVSAIASVLIDAPAYALAFWPPGALLSFVWLSITAWVKLIVGISILTAIYGVYVDKRSIA